VVELSLPDDGLDLVPVLVLVLVLVPVVEPVCSPPTCSSTSPFTQLLSSPSFTVTRPVVLGLPSESIKFATKTVPLAKLTLLHENEWPVILSNVFKTFPLDEEPEVRKSMYGGVPPVHVKFVARHWETALGVASLGAGGEVWLDTGEIRKVKTNMEIMAIRIEEKWCIVTQGWIWIRGEMG
jgi:hypothetical protein